MGSIKCGTAQEVFADRRKTMEIVGFGIVLFFGVLCVVWAYDRISAKEFTGWARVTDKLGPPLRGTPDFLASLEGVSETYLALYDGYVLTLQFEDGSTSGVRVGEREWHNAYKGMQFLMKGRKGKFFPPRDLRIVGTDYMHTKAQ